MQRIGIIFFIIVSFVLVGEVKAEKNMTAQKVIDSSYDLYRRHIKLEKEKVDIEVKYEAGRTVEKKLIRWIQYNEDRQDKVYMEFIAPPMDDGLKLLVNRQVEENDLMWLKLPSLDRPRRISGQDEGNYFAETDLTYRDTAQLVGEAVDNYHYSFVGTERCSVPGEKEAEWIIKAEPKESITAIYGHRLLFVTKDLVVVAVKYFHFNGEVIKVQVNNKVVQDENKRWRADLVVIKNRYNSRTTEIKVKKRDYNNAAQAPSFSKRDLRR